jgi:hypothetical protein
MRRCLERAGIVLFRAGFFACGPLSGTTTCSSGGSAIGAPVSVTAGPGNTATATSPSFTPTSAGRYCFRAEYGGDTSYAASSDGSSGECFQVIVANDLKVIGKSFTTSERISRTHPVASFTDPGSTETPASFSATITWGDGTSSAAGVITGSAGKYAVAGSHTYVDEGQFIVSVVVTEIDGDTPAPTATATGTATVAEADVSTPKPRTFTARHGVAFSGVVATFADAVSNDATDFTALIDRGDGTAPSAGTVTASGKTLSVAGTHTYATVGTFPVAVTITDGSPGTAQATASSTAAVT